MSELLTIRRCYRGAVVQVVANYLWFALGLGGIVAAWLVVEWIVIFSPLSTSRIAWWVAHIGYFFLTAIPEVVLLRLGIGLAIGRRPPGGLKPAPAAVVRYTLIKLLAGAALVAGFALLIVPGLYAGARLLLWAPCAVSEPRTVLGSLEESLRLSRGRSGSLMMLVVSLLMLNIAGLALMGAGLLLTIPISYIVVGRVFCHVKPSS